MLFVFMSQPDFGCNPYALWKYIEENTAYNTAWIIKCYEYLEEIKERGIRCALYNTIDGQLLIDEADYVVMNSYTFLDLKKRDGQIWVNLWHGSGIKAHDYYNHDISPKHVKKLHDYFQKVDVMCVHSLDDRFKLAAQLHFDMRHIYVTGQARLDNVVTSKGRELLRKLYGDCIDGVEKLIFFAPSFRANMSSHSGTIYSNNIFRLPDYEDEELLSFLEEHNAAIIYKLHPVEQIAFSGRRFHINSRCFELTDKMLFDADIRYYDILNAFDVMISDYSSIAFDYLLLNRPIVYLIPDYEEYTSDRGFVFAHVEDYMPGDKAFNFNDMMIALQNAFSIPDQFKLERQFVLRLEKILQYEPITDIIEEYHCPDVYRMPSVAEHISQYIDKSITIVDSLKVYSEEEKNYILGCDKILYITGEIPNKYRHLTGQSSDEIVDLQFYYDVCNHSKHQVFFCQGGVDFARFSSVNTEMKKDRMRIGFAGTIDNRIYFAMVQCICEVYAEYEVIFAGNIHGDYPVWLDGFDNLYYVPAKYEELPEIISGFDITILPFFGRHQQKVPTEFYQYLASGKQVIASDMINLPEVEGVYKSKSVAEAIDNIKEAIKKVNDKSICLNLQRIAYNNDWKKLVEEKLSNQRIDRSI